MAERRSAARKKSFLQGRIFFNQRRTSVDCLIRDFCEHGARLTFSSMTATPDVVELYIPNKDESYRAKVQWRNANEIGVGFEREAASPPLVPEAAAGRLCRPASTSSSTRFPRCSASSTSCRRWCGRSRARIELLDAILEPVVRMRCSAQLCGAVLADPGPFRSSVGTVPVCSAH